MKPYLLGIDIGTSACKVAVFNRNGEVLSQANGSYSVYYPKPGWAEQNPEEWWDAVCLAVKEALQKGEIHRVKLQELGLMGRVGRQ